MPRHSLAILFALLPGSLVPAVLHAQSCPADETAMCYDGACICIPPLSGDLQTMADQALQVMEEMRAPALEVWLLASRDAVHATSAPIPPAIRAALVGYVPEDILDLARFKVGGGEGVNLADMALKYGDLLDGRTVTAITLVDVIVFRSEDDAFDNAALWAHELTHVRQFRDWGAAGFAERYIADPLGVEAPAYAVGDAYESWRERNLPLDD